MIQSIFIGIALITSLFGLARTPTPIWDNPGLQLGATNFPTSLDSLTNPAATDSVATVSHSSQHANANDALEALEAKVGINASTPVTDSIFVGTSAGGSQWSTYATTTSLRATNITATGSTTLQNFTFVNATGTSATTTNFNTTNATSTNFYGADLSSCTGTNKLLWTAGRFSCAADSTGSISFVATSTATSTNNADVSTSVFKQTASFTVGQTIVAWANVLPDRNADLCGQDKTLGLYIKPTSSATSTIALGFCDIVAGDEVTVPFTGIYVIAAAESHEIYIGLEDNNKNYFVIDYGSMLYQVVNP